jgi:hypothetical protein
MPFELGIDYGIRQESHSYKRILVLEGERRSYSIALSDIASRDIHAHENKPEKLVGVIRDWLINNEMTKNRDGERKIWAYYLNFQAFLFEELVSIRGFSEEDTEKISVKGYTELVEKWKENQ